MVNVRKLFEAILGGLLFGAIYTLSKYELDLEYEGVPVEANTFKGQVFWFLKIAIGLVASKYASAELIGLLDTTEPIVEEAIDVDGRRRGRRRSKSSFRTFVRNSPPVTRKADGISTPSRKHRAGCPCC